MVPHLPLQTEMLFFVVFAAEKERKQEKSLLSFPQILNQIYYIILFDK
jgi:hypothetical protein